MNAAVVQLDRSAWHVTRERTRIIARCSSGGSVAVYQHGFGRSIGVEPRLCVEDVEEMTHLVGVEDRAAWCLSRGPRAQVLLSEGIDAIRRFVVETRGAA